MLHPILAIRSGTLDDKPASIFVASFGNRGDFGKRSSGNASVRVQRRRCLILMRQTGDRENSPSGDEPPETLFMRELRRRGMSPNSLSNDDQTSSSGSTGTGTKTKEGENDDLAGTQRVQSSGSTVKAPSGWYDERSQVDQRQRSMDLNSEGLDGLIPRARALLTLGGSFFLVFWPLILSSLTIFVALYIYYGPTFLHSGNQGGEPQYVDPYQLLDNERLPSELGPSRVPYNYPSQPVLKNFRGIPCILSEEWRLVPFHVISYMLGEDCLVVAGQCAGILAIILHICVCFYYGGRSLTQKKYIYKDRMVGARNQSLKVAKEFKNINFKDALKRLKLLFTSFGSVKHLDLERILINCHTERSMKNIIFTLEECCNCFAAP